MKTHTADNKTMTYLKRRGGMMTDKQALKRQYLDTKTRAGVYAIRNKITGRVLVAGSANVQGTLNRHLFELRYAQHRNLRLAQDWVEYGESNFLFEVLDRVKASEDPAFDAARELEILVSLWRQEIRSPDQLSYDEPRKKP
ncbi:GIY-YIG nuclease family protein [Serratia sp. TSA_198.1]|uniref:GIY-YIG nuclease family protein n=1 Tax=Serratia sp. TSA_198.1 TaxID=3415664 RepID=UPI0040468470